MNFTTFADDIKTQDSVIRRLAVIGEAVNKLPDIEKQKSPETPWEQIVGMRNFLVHEYADVALERLWQTVQKRQRK
jgi:uncharacterized protein with HEPN domain